MAPSSAPEGPKVDQKREWRPDTPCGYAPLFVPSQWGIMNFAKYFFGYPGFFWCAPAPLRSPLSPAPRRTAD